MSVYHLDTMHFENNIIPKKRSFDATKAFKTFGFKSKTSIYDGLKKIINLKVIIKTIHLVFSNK